MELGSAMKARIRSTCALFTHKGWDHDTALRKACDKLASEWHYVIPPDTLYWSARAAGLLPREMTHG